MGDSFAIIIDAVIEIKEDEMFRNERYFDKNDNKKNYYGQYEDAQDETEDQKSSETAAIDRQSEPQAKGN